MLIWEVYLSSYNKSCIGTEFESKATRLENRQLKEFYDLFWVGVNLVQSAKLMRLARPPRKKEETPNFHSKQLSNGQ